MEEIKQYIDKKWEETYRFHTEDVGKRYGLPYPYTVPSAKDAFNEMYYWDTYFTNKGLILSGRADMARNNCDNIAYLIEKFGYMPNGSTSAFLGRSQPPFFALMCKDVYVHFGDKAWLKGKCEVLAKELDFWENNRKTPSGLNKYSVDNDDKWCENFLNCVKNRVNVGEVEDAAYVGRCFGGEAESGWDFTARFEGRCCDCNPIDLNCLLYASEKLLAHFERETGRSDGAKYDALATARAALVQTLLFDTKRGVYLDYNYQTKRHSSVLSAASFMPYYVGLAPTSAGLDELLSEVELEYGISCTGRMEGGFQWGYPNGWAPLHLLAVGALARYQRTDDARRVAKKYCTLVERNFETTGGLWEKYNALTGGNDAVSEYGTPQMMGWTAGTYLALDNYLNEGKPIE